MLFRQMLWLPRRVPVCVFEHSRDGLLRSNVRLVFVGRLVLLPVLFLGAKGYFAYLADQDRLRSSVLTELKRIMVTARLDEGYEIENWFMKKNRLFVYVAKKARRIGRGLDSPPRGLFSRIGRRLSRIRFP